MIRRLILLLTLFATAVNPLAFAFAQTEAVVAEDIIATRPATPEEKGEFEKLVLFGKRFSEIGDYRAAWEKFDAADRIFSDQPGVLFNLSVLLIRLGRFSEAQAKVNRYQSHFPEGEEIARIKMLQLELDFQRELEKRQQETKGYVELFNRGRYEMANGQFSSALRIFDEAGQKKPNDSAVSYNQALSFERLGEFGKASEHFRRYLELATGAANKNEIDQRLFRLESELNDMQSMFVCSFCGHKLPLGTTWCHRCWHGPYLFGSPQWNSRPCSVGAAATRTTFYQDGRFGGNEELACTVKGGLMKDALRYTPVKRMAIQNARRAEGWTYENDLLTEKKIGSEVVIRLDQGTDYLERLRALGSGDVLSYEAAREGSQWLLQKEDIVFDGIEFVKTYTYAGTRFSRESVTYQNKAACDHVISMTATYQYNAERLASVQFGGGYTGFKTEGLPVVEWSGKLVFSYDDKGRVEKEEFTVDSFTKNYTEKPASETRKLVKEIYPSFRPSKPMDVIRSGDLCGMAGNRRLGNQIDLRPFYTISPSFPTLLPFGTQRMTIDYTYPDDYVFTSR
jgi:tetratricopeptide (TPR) repeat protein